MERKVTSKDMGKMCPVLVCVTYLVEKRGKVKCPFMFNNEAKEERLNKQQFKIAFTKFCLC